MNPNLKVRHLTPTATTPTRAHPDDAGLDLYACAPVMLTPGVSTLVSTGIAVSVPPGHVGFITPRSGLATKHGVTVCNAPGTIDAGYTGEVKVNLINHSGTTYDVDRGDRIAQIVIIPITTPGIELVDTLDGTERGNNGHGSTGA